MDAADLKTLFAEVNKRMTATLEHVRHELAGVRTGRASVTILDNVHIEAYGSRMPLNQVAGLSIPEPTLIVAQPFDPSLLGAIEKAIRSSDLGLNPANDGKVVRIPLPMLTEERRREIAKNARKHGEECKIAIRKARKDAKDMIDAMVKDGDTSEDEGDAAWKKAEEFVAAAVKVVDDIVAAKEKDLMTV